MGAPSSGNAAPVMVALARATGRMLSALGASSSVGLASCTKLGGPRLVASGGVTSIAAGSPASCNLVAGVAVSIPVLGAMPPASGSVCTVRLPV